MGALLTVSQEDAQCDVAESMLWLALWPGLDAMYGRLWRHFKQAPAELVSEIASRFTREINRIDLGRVNRIAATLIANIERDMRNIAGSVMSRCCGPQRPDAFPRNPTAPSTR